MALNWKMVVGEGANAAIMDVQSLLCVGADPGAATTGSKAIYATPNGHVTVTIGAPMSAIIKAFAEWDKNNFIDE